MITSLQSADTIPVTHTLQNNLCKAGPELSMECFTSSAVMLSEPADFPFFNLPTTALNSLKVGASVGTPQSPFAKSLCPPVPPWGLDEGG